MKEEKKPLQKCKRGDCRRQPQGRVFIQQITEHLLRAGPWDLEWSLASRSEGGRKQGKKQPRGAISEPAAKGWEKGWWRGRGERWACSVTCPWEPGRRLGPGGQQSLHSRVAERVREHVALGKTKEHSGASRA